MITVSLSDPEISQLIRLLKRIPVKLVEVRNHETIIEARGHRLSVPFLLDKSKKYQLVIRKDQIQLVIIPDERKSNNLLNRDSGLLKDELFSAKSQSIVAFIQNLFGEIFEKKEPLRFEKNYSFKHSQKNEHYLVFNMVTRNAMLTMGMKILEDRSVFLYFFGDDQSGLYQKVTGTIKEDLKDVLPLKGVLFFQNKNKFIEEFFNPRRVDLEA